MTKIHAPLGGAETQPVELRTDRLILREFTVSDLSGIHALVGDDRVTTWLSFDPRTHDEAADMLDGIVRRQRDEPRTEYYLAIVLPDRTTDIVGFARLGLSGVQAADLGYAFVPSAQGRGYGREAATAMLDFAFQERGLHRVVANIGPNNTRSVHLVTSLGFIREGTIRDHVFTNGGWRDSDSFSLLAHEWGNAPGHCGGCTCS